MRISGITVPDKKRLEYGLTVVHGVGKATARKVLKEAGVDFGKTPNDISQDEEANIRKAIEAMTIEGDLKRMVTSNIKRLKDIGAYRGTRHAKRLPARGQRTKTNSRTVRGNVRKTMGSGRRVLTKT